MGKLYKEELAEFKQYRRDPERLKRTYPKAKKLKPYKVFGIVQRLAPYNNITIVIGRYATPKDAEKAIKAAEKSGFYKEVKCEPEITSAQ